MAGSVRYIAAGCLIFDQSGSRLPEHLWSDVAQQQWRHFGPFGDSNTEGTGDNSSEIDSSHQPGSSHPQFLEEQTQAHFVASAGCLAPYLDILRNRWIRMSLGLGPEQSGLVIVRVYILPDDVENRTIPRRDPSFRKARTNLLSRLDFAPSTWNGQPGNIPSRAPSLFNNLTPEVNPQDEVEGQTLLQMFNNIPSPDPNPDDIRDYEARNAAYRVMSSNIFGLSTKLYSYQRRSAALMLEREAEPREIPDPRFVKVVDQLGMPYYYDPVTGSGLLEPRRYDGPCGGILAEEMGAGKTLICLALILATRHIPSTPPEHLRTDEPVIRPKVGSLADMAAACITRHSVPWKTVFGALEPDGIDYPLCVAAIQRNPGLYQLPPPARRRESRRADGPVSPTTVHLSHTSLVIVPPNLVQQWKQEITKHTSGLSVLIADKKQELPPVKDLLEYDVILFSSTRFERLSDDLYSDRNGGQVLLSPLAEIHFKRCIVDEGHKLGNSTISRKSNLLLLIDHLQISAKWIVTGTPSKGLFGVDNTPSPQEEHPRSNKRQVETSPDLEKEDLKRIGSIAMLYLRMRPWANQPAETGDSPADWTVYVMQPKHSARSIGRADCLRGTLESLIIRHRLPDLGDLLPSVDEKIVYLDGSFQDRLVLNLFSMMIIFNAVQSQRTDQDYFFHPRQRKALLELVHNLRQASFFGGSVFSPEEILKAVETAEEFLEERKVPIGADDEALLREAIMFGRLAEQNTVKRCANLFRELPLYVRNFPWGAGREWSLDLHDRDPVCTDSRMVSALQKLLQPLVDSPMSLKLLFDTGRFSARGWEERSKGIEQQASNGGGQTQTKVLAGNTPLGQDSKSSAQRRSAILTNTLTNPKSPVGAEENPGTNIAEPLSQAQLISTASAKLSYLTDQIVKYQDSEQIIVFYENDNVAYYLAGVLEILQIQHLIYAKGLTAERRSQYVVTFNRNPKFRVLLMDITQAAFGLDMQSASRIYFISPVLNPQVEAQAIGRVRRISQQKPVSVETLVLRGSVEEVVVRRRSEMTQAEMRKCRSILDDRPIYDWILNARILPLPGGGDVPREEQMARLEVPQFLFGRGFGRELSHPDQDLVGLNGSPVGDKKNGLVLLDEGKKRRSPGRDAALGGAEVLGNGEATPAKRARVRFAGSDDES
ncbi:P-loop containing nucleoside triphosphate hydrolase protein [Chaetomium sp. MPI-SDFR-AT-0129]|nr:P-loop containing nucleoside triphosphate hydrolase protein [Chaetomium sp. MPI-SDFR-AT-0129]